MRDFLGKTGTVYYEALKGGLNVVPLTISGDCGYEDTCLFMNY